VAGGIALLTGAFVWRLGIEFERMWIRSYDGPLVGEPPTHEDLGSRDVYERKSTPAGGGRRRWLSNHHPRSTAKTPHAA
jgi:hypothetical protein